MSSESSFGRRLREERDRLEVSQAAFAELVGVKRVTQHIFEHDVRLPDSAYLEAAGQIGTDVSYLVLGERFSNVTPFDACGLSRDQHGRVLEFVWDAGRNSDGDQYSHSALKAMFLAICAACCRSQTARVEALKYWNSEAPKEPESEWRWPWPEWKLPWQSRA